MALRSSETMFLSSEKFKMLCANSLYYATLQRFENLDEDGFYGVHIVLYQPYVNQDSGFVDTDFVKSFIRVFCENVTDPKNYCNLNYIR